MMTETTDSVAASDGKGCTRYAVRMQFADETFPRYVYTTSTGDIGTRTVLSLSICHRDVEDARRVMGRVGDGPWSLPLSQAPKIVDVDVTELLTQRADELRAQLAAITQELEDAKR